MKGMKPISGLSASLLSNGDAPDAGALPCGRDAGIFSNLFEDELPEKLTQIRIRNNLHAIQSANIPATIIGLTFVSHSIRDSLSESDKGPL